MKKIYQALMIVGASLLLFNNTNLQAQDKPLTKEEWMKQQEAEKNKFKEDYKAGFEQFKKERDEAIQKMDDEFKEFLKKE